MIAPQVLYPVERNTEWDYPSSSIAQLGTEETALFTITGQRVQVYPSAAVRKIYSIIRLNYLYSYNAISKSFSQYDYIGQ
ncbi:hypothetical protein [Gloeocapsopsis dulcis]|uniref:Uncharacterized protein n=1 Tax=Gloeocapsopsis dulcis AAB1 = 1H9 TaxID=1433147 RepID=A0A6N8G3J8_9CHRO|nr:hypothetical protein [Gloeocapsopsis dulcis]MUL39454.1 hypothetical protein [Gloeocapsopsis dulcis AAB1 = 1H9]WNN92148.1 hypothetical protein P0S91_26575 [Gloeocapsopsis dulcis]